ncbi:RAMP superfamily CRISPR-associated protein [Desulfococcaceae bacterium HSG8]|nr:RAMP superfamily CRISPR-associated protein [Desulfococcaceae bacterium HSG8]
MLKKMINSAQIDFDIIPIDPLLIKSGQATVGGVDMSFVRTYRFGEKEEPFIPGSSLKGMIRSYSEKICRSLRDNPVPVCLPYVEPGKEQQGERGQASCGLSFEKYKKGHEVKTIASPKIYSLSCPACRLFGSHGFIGRFSTSDAYLTEDFKKTGSPLLEIRDGVAIDRLTGGAAGGAKYDLEVLTRGEFGTTLDIRNFERWQLGLVGLVLRDMEQGLVRLGFGKSRGLGKFRAKISRFQLTYYNRKVSHLSGLSELCSKEENKAYGFFAETGDKSPMPEPECNGLRYEYDLADTWKKVLEPVVRNLENDMKNAAWPKCLEDFLKGGK